jgi:hypothetical protein
MKKTNLILITFICYLLFCSTILVAQQPGVDDGTGGVEGGDPPVNSINSKLILLALIGLFWAYKFFQKQKQHSNVGVFEKPKT